MREKCFVLIAILLLSAPVMAEEMTAAQIVGKHVEALGGQEAWSKVSSAKISGKMAMPGGNAMPMTLIYMSPNSMRMEMEMQGQKMIHAFDGESGWQVMPLMGINEPRKMKDNEADLVRRQADFQGPLIGYEKKGHTIELAGQETIGDRLTHKLKVTLNTGDTAFVFIDAESFLEIQQSAQVTNPLGQVMNTVTDVSDYRNVGDILMAHSRVFRPEGSPQGMSVLFDSVEIHPEGVDASLFAMPDPPPAPAPAQ